MTQPTSPDEPFDLTLLDRPEIIWSMFFPRREPSWPTPGTETHFIEVAPGVRVSCRFFIRGKEFPCVLFFHGNGEIANDYDYFAPLYLSAGLNLFVADYRGYGESDGTPTVSGLFTDAHPIYHGFRDIVADGGYAGGVFVMGRSLGNQSAIELGAAYQDELRGLIVESGGLGTFSRLLAGLGLDPDLLERRRMSNRAKAESIRVPTLHIHAEYDTIIPLDQGIALYEAVAATDKRLVIVPGADHNDIFLVGAQLYFDALREFIAGHRLVGENEDA